MINSNLTSFQTGVDSIYNKCVSCGSTPSTKTPAAIITSIQAIYTNRYNAGVSNSATVIKNLGNYTGSTTVNIKNSYSNYASLTNNNFIGAYSIPVIAQCTDQGNVSGTIARTLSYNASTGILTITTNYRTGPVHGTNHLYVSGTISTPVYLVY